MVSKPGKTRMWWKHFGCLKPSQIDIPRFSVVEIHPGLLGRSSYRLHWPVALCVGESLDGSRATCWVKGNIHLDSCWSTAINGLVKSTNWKNGSSTNHRLQVFTDYYSIILFNTRPSLRKITKTAVQLRLNQSNPSAKCLVSNLLSDWWFQPVHLPRNKDTSLWRRIK